MPNILNIETVIIWKKIIMIWLIYSHWMWLIYLLNVIDMPIEGDW